MQQIIGGNVHEVLGTAREGGEWTFAPAHVELEGDSFSAGLPLMPVLKKRLPSVLRALPERGTDAIWARSRIEAMFGIHSLPENQRVEKSMMQFGFVASRGEVAVVFECSDYYGKSALTFAETVRSADATAIANAFWSLVARDGELAEYRDRAFHSGAGVWMDYGYAQGKLFLDYAEAEEDEESAPPVDPVQSQLASDRHFFERLGPDRLGTVCRDDNCSRPTIEASLFCRWHHFEAVTGRAFPIPPTT